ncbi:hypothetical protein AAG906_028207 [Vitis piasezkii]
MSIRPSDVVIMSSNRVRGSSAVYWLYYTGYSSEKVVFLDDSLELYLENPERAGAENGENGGIGKIFKSLPGLAISQDGRHWARIEGEHHTGALFDVGLENEWDSMYIASPQVVFHGNDGIRWVKLGKIMGGGISGSFDESGVVKACVVKNRRDGKYVMAYEGVDGNGRRSIGLAVSPDGLKEWRRSQDEAVLMPAEDDGWDNKGVGSPCLVQMDGDGDGDGVSGDCITGALARGGGQVLEWQFVKEVIEGDLENGQDFICKMDRHCIIYFLQYESACLCCLVAKSITIHERATVFDIDKHEIRCPGMR